MRPDLLQQVELREPVQGGERVTVTWLPIEDAKRATHGLARIAARYTVARREAVERRVKFASIA